MFRDVRHSAIYEFQGARVVFEAKRPPKRERRIVPRTPWKDLVPVETGLCASDHGCPIDPVNPYTKRPMVQ